MISQKLEIAQIDFMLKMAQELARVRLSKEITIPEAGLVRVQVSGGHLMHIYNTIPLRPSR
jgi:hypothetical protein